MKKIMTVCLLLFCIFPLSGKTKKYAWDEFYLKGKVKTWEKTYYEVDKKGQKKEVQYKTVYTYDKHGLLTQVERYGRDMTIVKKTEYIYNKQHKVIAITEHKKKTKIREIVPYYDKKNNSIRLYTLENDEKNKQKNIKYIFKYNTKGNLVEKIIYNSDGTLFGKTKELYNAKQDYIGHSLLNSDGSIVQHAMYAYDSKGNIKELQHYGPDKILRGVFSFIHVLDKKGNAVKTYTYQKLQKNKKTVKELCAFSENRYTYW